MAKKTVNSDIYNLAKLVDDVKSIYIPNETEDTLAISTYGYLGALETKRLQTQVQMTGELSNEVFPSRARLERNVITHAIMANISDINASPAKMTVNLAIKESDIQDYFDSTTNIFTIDRECPLYIGDYEFHLEYDIKLKRIISTKGYTYTAEYYIPSDRDLVPTSTITDASRYLAPPVVVNVDNEAYIYLVIIIAQVEHYNVSKKLVTSNIIDNKTINFEFENQLAYFEIHSIESDEEYYLTPVFEGAAVPDTAKYYCWYQYIDTNLIRVRFDRNSYMPGLNATVECLVKTCQGVSGNFTYAENTYITLDSSTYGYKNINCLLNPVSDSTGGKDRKTKKELQSLIPKESLSRGNLTTITDLNNYFAMLDSEYGRIVIQKKIDNQIERVYYAYLVAKDSNNNVIPSNTIDIKVDLKDLVQSQIYSTDPPRYLLPAGKCFKLGEDGVAYINDTPIVSVLKKFTPNATARSNTISSTFKIKVTDSSYDAVSCGIDVGGCKTSTHVFPATGDSRYIIDETDDEIYDVEDYMQMGVGKYYNYASIYTTTADNTTLNISDDSLDCFDFISASYTIDGETTTVTSLPIVIENLAKDTTVSFSIIRRLNNKATNGFTLYTLNGKEYNASQSDKLSNILYSLGIKGEINKAESSDPEKVILTENGKASITNGNLYVLTGKDYDINIPNDLRGKPVSINAKTTSNSYVISVNQDNNTIENKIHIKIDSTEVKTITYVTYIPVLEQNTWPVALNEDDVISYTLTYKSTSNLYKPEITISLSKGLEYVLSSNEITYPDGTKVQIEPSTETPDTSSTFLYTNPYAININGYRLYSSFYMMSMNENPYLHFSHVNDLSNIQFISTNVYWNKPFVGENVDKYTMTYSFTQSVQEDLGVVPSDESGEDCTPLVKAIVVFKRDGKYYRYRSLNLDTYDPTTYSYTFSGLFDSKNKFDNSNNLKVTNMQYTGQAEYTVTLSYNDKTYTLTNGSTTNLSDILSALEITEAVTSAVSNNPSVLDVYKTTAGVYIVRSFVDFENYIDENIPVQITINESIKIEAISKGPNNYTISIGETNSYTKVCNISGIIKASDILDYFGITYTTIKSVILDIKDDKVVVDGTNIFINEEISDYPRNITISYDETSVTYAMSSTSVEYGFFEPNTEALLYILCGLPDTTGTYSRYDIDSICPGLTNWTVTNVYEIVNGLTMYHNYSEIMGSRCTPYGEDSVGTEITVMNLEGYYVKGVPMLGYEYCQDETLAQGAIDALNYRKAYIDSAVELLENSFGIDFKLFNTYGPSKIYYVINDSDKNNLLDDSTEFINSVNLTFYFRVKLISNKDNYTKDNIIKEIKEYIEDLDDISELHIPNLVTQITTNYKEQITYFEYLGFNKYGANVQHIYRLEDNEIAIHDAPEFLNINNILNNDGTITPDINIYVSEI